MRRFLVRIIVCLVPTLLSIGVVAWAYNQYQNGQGGFVLGVDLAGGTNLVYEVDETKMPEKFKAEDLAAALKKRIDPADLYNITIRPIAGNPPRVEIILPTGGERQARIEQGKWERLLEEAARDFPPSGGDENPYASIRRGNKGALADEIMNVEQKKIEDWVGKEAKGKKWKQVLSDAARDYRPPAGQADPYVRIAEGDKKELVARIADVQRSHVSDWIEQHTHGAGKGKRMLTGDEVENIKSLIARQGRLEFRILANTEDDGEAINAARDELKKMDREKLVRLEQRAEPPPPRHDDGSLYYPVKLPNEPEHTYSWVEIGKSQLYTMGLNSQALDRNPERKKQIEKEEASGQAFSWGPNLLYVRKITDWTRRNIRDKEQGKTREFYILVRDPLKGKEITGDYLVNARPGNKGADLAIDFVFNAEGGEMFYEVTSKNRPTGGEETGYKRQLAIIFDGQVTSAPNLISPIRTHGQITGRFTQQEIDDTIRILRAGALPATLKKDPVSENSMGATLGEITIKWGTISVGIAFLTVMVFMVFYYRFAGLVACVALLVNLLLTVAFMVLVQAAFTLPGLAGLVLMLGMAVDANVLIYERLREERERGATISMALRNGYDRAFPTILDTHLTSIFTAIVLYVVGNDQLKGFGISLTVGLIISLFTSLYMTRTLFEIWLYKGWLKKLSFFGGLVRLVHIRYWDFMSIRYYWFVATVTLTILGAALFIYRADSDPATGKATVLNIDFTGGTAYTGRLNEPMSLGELREHLGAGDSHELPDLSIQQIGRMDENGKTDMFEVRTSNKNQQEVLTYISEHMRRPDGKSYLKLLLLKTPEILFDAKKHAIAARLNFTDEKEANPEFASPSQVQRVIAREFTDRGKSPTAFSIERPADRKLEQEGHYSQLTVRLADPMPAAELKDILNDVQQKFKNSPQPERLEVFDAQLAADTQQRAMYAILASWAAILLYLWFRFGSWTFGAATVLCLIHDLFFTLGVIAACHYVHAWFGSVLGIQDFKIDLQSVAALLTLVGYSVNDTIVVFDRIREVRGKNPALTPQMINDGVNQTLTRTLLASATVFLVVFVLYWLGGEGVKLFAFVMIVGVVVGTYSSIYIASPLLLIFGEGKQHTAGLPDRAPATAERG